MKTISGTIAGLSVVGTASAKRTPEEIRQQAIKIRRESESDDAFKRYLKNHGFEIKRETSKTVPFAKETDAISTQTIEQSDLTLNGFVYTSDGVSYAHGEWDVWWNEGDTWNDTEDLGEAPKDVVGIGWEHSDYDINWDSWESDKYSTQETATVNNCAWKFSDGNATDEYVHEGASDHVFYGFCDVELTPTNPIEERAILLNYQHTWLGGTVNGISFDSSGGMSASFAIETQSWSSPEKMKYNDYKSN